MSMEHVTILLVEDDSVDATAVKRSFRQLRIANPLVEARNGIEALAHLRGEDGHAAIPAPCLVLLDLNMPRMDGLEFLVHLRDDPVLHSTQVIVLTTSNAEEDRIRAYEQNIAGYVLKHDSAQNFPDTIGVLAAYWRLIKFPPPDRPMMLSQM